MSVPSWAEPLLEQINGNVANGFFWQEITTYTIENSSVTVSFDPKAFSYWKGMGSYIVTSDYASGVMGGYVTPTALYVDNAGSYYNVHGTTQRKNIPYNSSYISAWQIYKNSNNAWILRGLSGGNPTDTINISWTQSTTLQTAIGYIRDNFRNVKIIVDGEDWTAETTYTWQSVPSISGKNGILSLPVLIDTDGNPVSSGSASDFSTMPSGAKVRTLADANV